MRLKSFTAKTMKEAMQMVRDALGEDAVIIATREEKNHLGQKMVHITAAIEKPMGTNFQDSAPVKESWDDDSALDDSATVTEELTDVLLHHGVPDDVLDQVISCASILGIEEPRPALMAALENLFKFMPLPLQGAARPLLMVGPPGAGKTLATAKCAAQAVMAGHNVAVITTDIERAGGREQLEAFTRLMDIDLSVAQSALQLKERVLAASNKNLILIDTQGINPFDRDDVKKAAALIGAMDCDPVFVLPASTNAEESAEMAQIFADIGATRLLPTRVDAARRLGSLLSAAYAGGLSFCDVSATAKVADGLSPLSPKRLTQLLMPQAKPVTMQRLKKGSS